jgi:hypothetical protein
MIIYRYGINSKSDTVDRDYRFKSCWTCYCAIYPQPVWVVQETGMNELSLWYEKQNSGGDPEIK